MNQQQLNQNNHPTEVEAARRIAQLAATNAALREALVVKNSHIAMLEEKLLKMSVELASSRAREDEQNLMNRQSQISQVSIMSEDDDNNMGGPADQIDDSTKSARAQRTPSDRPRFSFMGGWRNSSLVSQDDSMGSSSRSVNSGGGVGGIIGNIIKIDRSDKSEDLNVDFPTGGRRSMMIESSTTAPNSPLQFEQRRVTLLGFRKSELTDAVEETSCEHQEEELQAPSSSQRRRPNRSKLQRIQASTRFISSTVAFPREDDADSAGFDFDELLKYDKA